MRFDLELVEVIKESFYPDDHPFVQDMKITRDPVTGRRKALGQGWVEMPEALVISQTDIMGKAPQAWTVVKTEDGNYYRSDALLIFSDDLLEKYDIEIKDGTFVKFQDNVYQIVEENLPKIAGTRYFHMMRRPGRDAI